MKYIKGLDSIRALAVIMVIIWHWYPQYPLNTVLGFIQHFFIPTGEFGVTLFFVLSGYLITSILLKAKRESNNNIHTIKNFIIRRSLRIFPIYYLLIIIMILSNFPFEKGHLAYFLTYTGNFLSIKEGRWNNFSHTWSLSVEEQFYLIWPWLILYTKDKYLKCLFYSFIAMALFSVVLTVGYFHFKNPIPFTPSCFDAFGIGGLYAYSQLDPDKHLQSIKKFVPIFWGAVLVYFVWKLCPYFNAFPKFSFFRRSIDSIIAIGIIHWAINNKSIFIKKYFLENKLLNTIGKISYGLYLLHYP